MIQLCIEGYEKAQLEQVAELLITMRWGLDVGIHSNGERLHIGEDGQVYADDIYLLTAKTKSLLFDDIEALVKETFPDYALDLYSHPIVHMDWQRVKSLADESGPSDLSKDQS